MKLHSMMAGLVLFVAGCGEATVTAPEAVDAELELRDVPGHTTFIAAGGTFGVIASYFAEVYVMESDDPADLHQVPQYPATEGAWTVEEYVCEENAAGKEKCRWEVHTVPEELDAPGGPYVPLSHAGETLRNVKGTVIFFEALPGQTFRLRYRHQGEKNAEVLVCPLEPREVLYFCFSDGTIIQ